LRSSISGEITAKLLHEHGVNYVFGIPATHVIELYEGIRKTGKIMSVVGRNEQATCYMADGYSRRARTLGFTLVTGGPGLGNSISGLQCAYADSVPVLLLTSDLNPEERSRGPLGIPHETFDSFGLAVSTGAISERIDSVDRIQSTLNSVIERMLSGRYRPGVCLYSRATLESGCSNTVDSVEELQLCKKTHLEPSIETKIKQVASKLKMAQKPLILAGMGIYWAKAEKELISLLSESSIPCLTTVPSTGVLPTEGLEKVGNVSIAQDRRLLTDADFVLAIGASFGNVTTENGSLEINCPITQVNVDAHDIGHQYPSNPGILMDAKQFLSHLIEEMQDGHKATWSPRFAGTRRNPWVDAIDRATRDQTLSIAADVCITSDWLYKCLPINDKRRLFMPWNYMNLGWSYAAALGMKMAAPSDFVVSIMGDGGALFSLGEIATAVENNIPVCLLIFNNRSYGTISLVQRNWFDGGEFGVNLDSPNFEKCAEAFSIPYERCPSPESLEVALKRFSRLQSPSLIEVPISLQEQEFLSKNIASEVLHLDK